MDFLKLLEEAKGAGLRIRTDKGRLCIRGPASAENIVRKLAEHKLEIIVALQQRTDAVVRVDHGTTLAEYCSMLKAWQPRENVGKCRFPKRAKTPPSRRT